MVPLLQSSPTSTTTTASTTSQPIRLSPPQCPTRLRHTTSSIQLSLSTSTIAILLAIASASHCLQLFYDFPFHIVFILHILGSIGITVRDVTPRLTILLWHYFLFFTLPVRSCITFFGCLLRAHSISLYDARLHCVDYNAASALCTNYIERIVLNILFFILFTTH